MEKPSYAQARFSLSGGGPLRIPKLIQSDRAFVFLNYFGARSRNPFNAVSTLPTAAERSGDLSQSVARGPVVIHDPLTRLPFADNRIPASRINPAASGLLSFFPPPNQNGRGTFTFSGFATSGFDADGQPLAGTGFDVADFLLGRPQSSSVRFGGADTYFRSSSFSAFAQDDWRARPNLTLNAGLRYEFRPPLAEKYNRMATLDIAPGFMAVAPVTPGASGPYTGVFPRGLVNSDRNNLAPRFGLAWRPFPKGSTLVRAGYGWYYNASVYNQAASLLARAAAGDGRRGAAHAALPRRNFGQRALHLVEIHRQRLDVRRRRGGGQRTRRRHRASRFPGRLPV
ncbi:MAG: TonB-dependent receptor [Acidobacteriota bacterium]